MNMDDKYIKARMLRNNMTPQEKKLWYYLRNRNLNNCRFRRQYPIGIYIVDFVCRSKHLIIEIDGGQHNTQEKIQYDNERTEYLNKRGFKVIRFWNNEIDNNIEAVINKIIENL